MAIGSRSIYGSIIEKFAKLDWKYQRLGIGAVVVAIGNNIHGSMIENVAKLNGNMIVWASL